MTMRKLRIENGSYFYGIHKNTFRKIWKPEFYLEDDGYPYTKFDEWDSLLISVLKWYNLNPYKHLSRVIVKIFRNEFTLNHERFLIFKKSKRYKIKNGRKYVLEQLAQRAARDYHHFWVLEDEADKNTEDVIKQIYYDCIQKIWQKSCQRLTYYKGRDEYKLIEPVVRFYLKEAKQKELQIYEKSGIDCCVSFFSPSRFK